MSELVMSPQYWEALVKYFGRAGDPVPTSPEPCYHDRGWVAVLERGDRIRWVCKSCRAERE